MIQRNRFSPLPRARFIQGPAGPRPLLAGLLIVLTVWACGGEESTGPGQQPAASVAVTPSTAFLLLGETLQFTASAQDANGMIVRKTFTWSSSDESIATVTDSGNFGGGIVSALANGSVTITAAADDVEGTAAIEVGAFTGPSGRVSPRMAYDAESDRVIMHGGSLSPNEFPNDTWTYDFNTNAWTDMNSAPNPGGRFAPAIAYDAQSDRVILFGGLNSVVFLSDTWAYDFNTNSWTHMNPPSGPTGRFGHRMVYDAQSDRIILFGGSVSGVLSDETWAYDFDTNAWTQLSTIPRPPRENFFAIAYDAQSDRVILFGGFPAAFTTQTWAYDFNTNVWTDMNPATQPSLGFNPAMAYDAQSDQVILFGGGIWGPFAIGDTWAYDFNRNVWTNMNSVVHPSGRWSHAMAYDEGSDRVVLFGGEIGGEVSLRRETWVYDFNTNTWTHMQ